LTRRVAVIGTGLIGASIGLGLRLHAWEVVGWDPSPNALVGADAVGALDHEASSPTDAMVGADLVVLAGPALAIIEQVASLDTPALVIDVAGVKAPIVTAAAPGARFVGTHPMAGREHAGPEHASAGLFRGATWVVTTDEVQEADLVAVENIVHDLGGIPVRMSANRHDTAVATVSHLPQLMALALVETASDDDDAMALAAGGFRDLTRIALSDPTMWADVLVANRLEVGEAVARIAARMDAWVGQLTDTERVRDQIGSAREVRQTLAPPIVAIRVILEDRPGSLAAVGRALSASRADVRDLQLRHGRHGGGGVLTLSVRPGEAEALRHALEDEHFEIV